MESLNDEELLIISEFLSARETLNIKASNKTLYNKLSITSKIDKLFKNYTNIQVTAALADMIKCGCEELVFHTIDNYEIHIIYNMPMVEQARYTTLPIPLKYWNTIQSLSQALNTNFITTILPDLCSVSIIVAMFAHATYNKEIVVKLMQQKISLDEHKLIKDVQIFMKSENYQFGQLALLPCVFNYLFLYIDCELHYINLNILDFVLDKMSLPDRVKNFMLISLTTPLISMRLNKDSIYSDLFDEELQYDVIREQEYLQLIYKLLEQTKCYHIVVQQLQSLDIYYTGDILIDDEYIPPLTKYKNSFF